MLGYSYAQKSMFDEALVEIKRAIQLYDAISDDAPPEFIGKLGYVHAMAGNTVEAGKILHELRELFKRRYFSPHWIALVHTGLGERDEALRWLEKAQERPHALFGTAPNVDPIWDPLRSDPRFQDLLRRMGLPADD